MPSYHFDSFSPVIYQWNSEGNVLAICSKYLFLMTSMTSVLFGLNLKQLLFVQVVISFRYWGVLVVSLIVLVESEIYRWVSLVYPWQGSPGHFTPLQAVSGGY